MPELEAVRRELEPRGVGFLAVALWDELDQVDAAAERLAIQMPVVMATGETLGPNEVRNVPAVLFVNREGLVTDRVSGAQSRRELLCRAEALLAAP